MKMHLKILSAKRRPFCPWGRWVIKSQQQELCANVADIFTQMKHDCGMPVIRDYICLVAGEMVNENMYYHKVSNIRRTKSQNLNASRLLL